MKIKSLCFIALCLAAPASQASPIPDVDTLQVSARTIYPLELKTVGQAVQWLMEPLGYHILTEYPAPSSAKTLLESPIPTAAKMHRTMPVTHALQLLIGEGNTIIVDKGHKLITFSKGVIL